MNVLERCQLEHVGSTSVQSLMAKPTIDIAASVSDLRYASSIVETLCRSGYHYEPELRAFLPNRHFVWAGSPRAHTFHVHIVEHGGDDWLDLLDFRDYLRAHPEAAVRYSRQKSRAARRAGDNIGAYVQGKAKIYHELLELARAVSPRRRTAAKP